ncbi:MAG: MFS transporter [Oscillospiraceae bacterium]|jgi:Na+/melibiose symporter-like transporter|nr:MFS transporter [Oscillospiraceae bacterium]
MKKLKLNYRRTFIIGFGFLASSIAWSMYNAFVPPMLENTFVPQIIAKLGLNAGILTTLTGIIMTLDNIFGVIFQPVFGALSDRTRTKIGRRMPYITIGLPVCAVLFALIPLMPSLAMFMFVLIVFNFVMSIWRAPVVALMPDLTPAPLRSQANGVINLMGGIGSILAFLIGGLLADMWAPAPFFFSSAVMLAALVVLRVFVKEPPGEAAIRAKEEGEEDKSIGELPAEEKKARTRSLIFLLIAIFFWFNGYNAIETLFTLYAINVLGVTEGAAAMMLAFFSVTFIAVSIPAGLLANRIGRRNAILIGLAGVTLLFPAVIFVKSATVVRLMLLAGGAFWAFVNINSLPMVLQLCSHKDIGRYTGYYYLFSFSANITAPILAGLLRDIVQDYGSVFLYAGVAYLLAFLCVLLVRHGELPKEKQSVDAILDQMDN